MRGAALAVVMAVLAAAGAIYYWMNGDEQTQSALPPDPAGRRAAALSAMSSQGISGKQAQILLGQAIVETGNFASPAFAATLSMWNRHVGSGQGDWNGNVYYTSSGEDLRSFDSLEQCVRDMKQLLTLAIYAKAKSALEAGDAAGYAREIKNAGFAEAANYTAMLMKQYAALGIA